MAGHLNILLLEGQGQARRHSQLLLHQINSGDQLRDRMLHLNTGIHLDKIEGSIGGQDKLHRPRAHVARRLGGGHSGPAHLLPQGGGEGFGGRFLYQLLPAALDGTVPLPQMDHMALSVRHDLELDVPGIDHQLFQIQLPVAKAGHGLRSGLLPGPVDVLGAVRLAHPPAPASGRGFQQNGIAHLAGQRPGLTGIAQRSVRPGYHRNPGALGQGPGGGLATQLPDDVPGGTNVL